MRKNSEHTLYARPVHPPAPPRRRFWRLVPSWSPTVAACRGVRVVDEWNCRKWKSTLVDVSRRSRDLTRQAEQNAKLGWWPQQLYYIIKYLSMQLINTYIRWSINITLLTVFPIGTSWNHLVLIGNWLEIIPSGPIRIDLSDRNPVGQIGQIPYYLGGTVFQNFRLIPLGICGAQTRPLLSTQRLSLEHFRTPPGHLRTLSGHLRTPQDTLRTVKTPR